jgi:hypothetical protein
VRHLQAFFPGSQATGRDDRIYFAGREKNEISCAKDADLCDNDFNIGGLAIWEGIGRMNGNDQCEADSPLRSAKQNILSSEAPK